jgi:photosystem II stability/assembly factor-like uncharacterized protein
MVSISCEVALMFRDLRRRTLILVAALAVALVSAGQGNPAVAGVNQWTDLGPEGGWVLALAISGVDPDIVYAGTFDGGVYRSDDGGANWTRTIAGGDYREIAIHPADPDIIFAAGDDGLWSTRDGGESWQPANGQMAGRVFSSVAFDPVNPATLYAGIRNGDAPLLYKSIDGGKTWEPRTDGLGDVGNVSSIVVDPTNGDRVYFVDDSGIGAVYRSTDGGETWEPTDEDMGPDADVASDLAIDSAGILYGATFESSYKSTDGGDTWDAIDDAPELISVIAVSPADDQVVYAATLDAQVHRSTNGGADWDEIGDPDLGVEQAEALAGHPEDSDTLFAGYEGLGVLVTENDGQTWNARNDGLFGVVTDSLAVNPANSQYLVATAEPNYVFLSTNGGATWTKRGSFPDFQYAGDVVIDPETPGTFYVSSWGPGVYKTTDDGESFEPADEGMTDPFVIVLAMKPDDSQHLLAGDGLAPTIYISRDGAGEWDATGGILPDTTYMTDVVFSSDPDIAYAAGHSDKGDMVYRSQNAGATWAPAGPRLPVVFSLERLAVDPTDPEVVLAATLEGIYRSENAGASWEKMSDDPGRAITFDPTDSQIVYVGSEEDVLRSSDGGDTWAVLDPGGLGRYLLGDLAIHPSEPRRILLGVYGAGVKSYDVVPPVVDSVNPATGDPAGGTAVTITGSAFAGGASVTFNGAPALNVVVIDESSITAVTPPHESGPVDVTVTNPDGESGTLAGGFNFVETPAPTVTGIDPAEGDASGGTAVTISGSGFLDGAGVSFNGAAALNVTVVNQSSITAVTPAHASGTVDVTVTNPDGKSGTLENGFTFQAPPAGVDLFEGWNPVEWQGADIVGVQPLIDHLNSAVTPNLWDTIARNEGDIWLQTFKDAPLPSFNTLPGVEAGLTYWIFVTDSAVLTMDPP